jgi:hypothetical protein
MLKDEIPASLSEFVLALELREVAAGGTARARL